MPRKKKAVAADSDTTVLDSPEVQVPQQPKTKEETRLYQVTLSKDGRVAGTEKQYLTKKQALDMGFPWT